MNAGSDYDDSSDDEHPPNKKQDPSEQPTDKHRALYAAATGGDSFQPAPPYERGVADSTQEQRRQPEDPANGHIVQQPQPVVHSRERNEQVAQQLQLPAALQSGARPIAAPAPAHSRPPQVAFMQASNHSMAHIGPSSPSNPYFTGVLPGSPISATRTPQPLPPPQSPIMPVFVRPRKESNTVKFNEKEILRGNSEETLLPRGVGGKGDDFWRRFSMVAKEEAKSGSKKRWIYSVSVLALQC
jgi:hypothetical protein